MNASASVEVVQTPRRPSLIPNVESPLSRLHLNRALDDLSLRFVIASRRACGPVLDFGCANGLAALAALARGAHVCAVDEHEAAVRNLLAQAPSQQLCRLSARVDTLVNIDFKDASFHAIHAARVLHQLDGVAVAQLLKKFNRWLIPHGRLFLSALAPTGSHWKALEAEYLRRNARGDRWPGYLEGGLQLSEHGCDEMSVHLLDVSTLRRELEIVGFEIEEMRCVPLRWQEKLSSCEIIARRA